MTEETKGAKETKESRYNIACSMPISDAGTVCLLCFLFVHKSLSVRVPGVQLPGLSSDVMRLTLPPEGLLCTGLVAATSERLGALLFAHTCTPAAEDFDLIALLPHGGRVPAAVEQEGPRHSAMPVIRFH